MKDPKGRKIIGFDKHVFVCENVREENHPRKCCSSKTKSNIKILFKNELKKYEPIGCRDLKTTDKLKNKGIDAYFSGCLTTTIDFFKWNQQNETIFNTDTKAPNGTYISQVNKTWKNISYW